MRYEDILRLSRIEGLPGSFQLGILARRVTLHSQQIRALNLVDAIHFYVRPVRDLQVAVVGAGASGLIAAARLVAYGADVTVFEKNPDIMSLQSSCHHRWLHPSIYDWPFIDVHRDAKSELPMMQWEAADADGVARQLKRTWQQARSHDGHAATVVPFATVDRILPDGNSCVLHYKLMSNGTAEARSAQFTLVILAVGFGLEPEGHRYWADDPLAWIGDDSERHKNILVAGYGDGALTDLMRSCLLNFDHKGVLTDIVGAIGKAEIEHIKSIESHPRAGDAAFLTEQYKPLRLERLIEKLSPLARTGRRVVLSGPGTHMFDPGASALNRLVVSQLLQIGAFHLRPLQAGERISEIDDTDPVIARIATEWGDKFTLAIRRFGPRPVWRQIAGVPEAEMARLKSVWDAIPVHADCTKDRIWGEFRSICDDIEQTCLVMHASRPDYAQNGLIDVINSSVADLADSYPVSVSKHIWINDCLKTEEQLGDTVRALCRAPIVILFLGGRMGQDNPGGMFLLGIRAAVRKGLTLVIHDGRDATPDWSRLPFNLKELQVLSLTEPSPEVASELYTSLTDGLDLLDSGADGYQDLPAFDVVRRSPRQAGVGDVAKPEALVLCSFSSKYLDTWQQLRLLIRDQSNFHGDKISMKQVRDYQSPLLVGERLYELVRHSYICIADLTEWRANVLFELGVRFAVSPHRTICIFRSDAAANRTNQRGLLLQLLSPLVYTLGRSASGVAKEFGRRLNLALNIPANTTAPPNSIHAVAQRSIFVGQEFGRLAFDESVLRQVEAVVGTDPTKEGGFPFLFSENLALRRQVLHAAVEALTAARLLVEKKLTLVARGSSEEERLLVNNDVIRSRLHRILDLLPRPDYDGYR